MQLAFVIGGGAPLVLPLMIGGTIVAGSPVVGALDGDAGALAITNAAFANILGVSLEAVTHVTAQQADNSDSARFAKCVCNPDAVFKAKFSGALTPDEPLPVLTVDTADSAGTSVETDTDTGLWDNGTVWGLSGANKGRVRKVDEEAGNHISVLVPFEAIAVGDTFLATPWFVGGPNLTAELTEPGLGQLSANTAIAGHVPITMVSGEFNGRGDSFGYIMFRDHAFAADQT
jgi:hypothetical protein